MNIRKPVATLATLTLATLVASAAFADPLPRAASAQAERCVGVIRAKVRDGETTLIRHTVTAIGTRGARREFLIESTVYGAAGSDAQGYISRCLAQRWGDGAELQWLRPVASVVVMARR
ncbi:MAG: hypothetical protein OEW72_03620 [Gammaproteobacteria bacterium]|nr:hypothetical protein [Gammaproteobacteria bacterium]